MWGQCGPFVVEIIWSEKMRHSYHVFDTQHEAKDFRKRHVGDQRVYRVGAWDLSGGWQQ